MQRTRALAESLGAVTRIPFDRSAKPKVVEDDFKYLLVLDFESTCWKDRSHGFAPEIIEFPVVLLDLSTGQIVSEFHEYVMPTEHPKLSDFCTELTGISQDTVDNGVPLSTCLVLFKRWMADITNKYALTLQRDDRIETGNHLYSCCTWSDWDLSLCLENECKRKQLKKPVELRSWIDIRAVYRTFYQRKPQGLNGALRDIGLEFVGREHSGIEDARNTAALVHHMVRQGCKLQPTSGEGPKTNQLRETPTEDVEINGSPRGRPEVSERKRSRRPFYGKQIYQKENLDNVKISIPK